MEFRHKSVLLDECIENLNIKKDGIYVDGTLGGAGHSYEILKRLNGSGKLIGIDRDLDALQAAKEKLHEFNNSYFIHDNNSNIKYILDKLNIDKVDGILLDLGVSSYQLDEADRGFSYMKDAPLDMRMNREDTVNARDVVNNYSKERLVQIFKDYGEERYSKKIANKICDLRKEKNIETTFELVEIIKSAIPKDALNQNKHPAKRIFQAIRIEVNEELTRLKNTIINDIERLKKNGRLVIITFHSLEDKIVKHTFEQMQGKCTCPRNFPVCVCGYKSFGKIVTKKPILPTLEELDNNPRARSAKLRIFERL